jgi:hypothetical protein
MYLDRNRVDRAWHTLLIWPCKCGQEIVFRKYNAVYGHSKQTKMNAVNIADELSVQKRASDHFFK